MARTYTKSELVTERTHDDLCCLKMTPREPVGDVIARLVKFYQTYGSIPRELETSITED